MDQKQKRLEEREDIGRILIGLLSLPPQSDPLEVAEKYATRDSRRFKKAVEKHNPVKIENLWHLSFLGGDFIFVGGGGVVLQCRNHELQAITYALKIQRPSLLAVNPGKSLEVYYEARQEYLNHAPLSHINIARLFGAGLVAEIPVKNLPPTTAHPVLMEWVEGARPLWRHLLESAVDASRTIRIMAQCFTALAHLHGARLIHWDIKSDNILVNAEGTVKLTDVGNARSTDDPKRGLTAYSTRGNLPPALEPDAEEIRGATTRRLPIALPDLSWDSPWVDLWMLAWDLNRLFGAADDAVSGRLPRALIEDEDLVDTRARFLARVFPLDSVDSQFVLGALRLILRRLLRPNTPRSEMYYSNATEVVSDLEKILPEFGAAQAVPELRAVPQHVLRLPVSGNVPFSERVGRLYNQELLQTLGAHLQLATVTNVYPGANHRRVEHVAGVLGMVREYVRALYADRTSPFWRLQIERVDIEALLVAALLHDVGHVAFGHFLEELEGLLCGRTHEALVIALLDPSRAASEWPGWREGSGIAHWLTRHREALYRIIEEDWCHGKREAEDFCRLVGEILRPPREPSPINDPEAIFYRQKAARLKLEVLNSIIDSAIDADKLDYLLRDAHHAGVKYTNGIDVDRFLQALTTITHVRVDPGAGDQPSSACIGVTAKGQLPVESILIGRYQMFASVYWQHTTRAETAMLQYAVQEFVGACRSEAAAIKRLDELLNQWRQSDDRAALEWLAGRVEVDARKRRIPKARYEVLSNLMAGLRGDRRHLYWQGFELRYERGGEDAQSYASRIAEYWLRVAEQLSGHENPLAFIKAIRLLRAALASDLEARLGLGFYFQDGELLVDIPPAGKDQIDNVFVVRGHGIRALKNLTPIADAVHVTFARWVRAVRVFLAPSAWERLFARDIREEEVWSHAWNGLKSAADGQLELFPDDDGPGPSRARSSVL